MQALAPIVPHGSPAPPLPLPQVHYCACCDDKSQSCARRNSRDSLRVGISLQSRAAASGPWSITVIALIVLEGLQNFEQICRQIRQICQIDFSAVRARGSLRDLTGLTGLTDLTSGPGIFAILFVPPQPPLIVRAGVTSRWELRLGYLQGFPRSLRKPQQVTSPLQTSDAPPCRCLRSMVHHSDRPCDRPSVCRA